MAHLTRRRGNDRSRRIRIPSVRLAFRVRDGFRPELLCLWHHQDPRPTVSRGSETFPAFADQSGHGLEKHQGHLPQLSAACQALEAQSRAGLHAFQYRVRLVHADSAGPRRGDALRPAQDPAGLVSDLLQLFRGGRSRAGDGAGCAALYPDGFFPVGSVERYRPGDDQARAFAPVRHAPDDPSFAPGPGGPVFPVGHFPAATAGRRLHRPYQRRRFPHSAP